MTDELASPERRTEVGRTDVTRLLFTIAIVAGIGMNFQAIIPSWLVLPLSAISIAAGYLGILIHFATGRSSALLIAWLATVAYMLAVGAARSSFFRTDFNAWTFFVQDLRYVMYFAIGIILASPRYLPTYHRLMVLIGGLAVAGGVLGLLLFDFDSLKVAEGIRLGTWGPSYYLWWLSGGAFAYLYPYARLVGRDRWLGYAVFGTYVVLGLLFMKRSTVVNLVFVVLATEIAAKYLATGRLISMPSMRQLSRIIVVVPLILASVYLLGRIPYVAVLFDRLMDRFNSESFDRQLEASAYFDSASIGEIVTGQGIGHYTLLTYSSGEFGVSNLSINALHIGFLNTIYKGGIVYLGFTVVTMFILLHIMTRRPRVSPYFAVCLVASFSFALSLFYEMSWTYTLVGIGYATPLAYVIEQSQQISRKR